MPERFDGTGERRRFERSRSDAYFVGSNRFAIAEMQGKRSVGIELQFMKRDAGFQNHPGIAGGFHETIDDRLRAIGHRKHPAIGFRLQLYPARFEPRDRILRLPFMKRPA